MRYTQTDDSLLLSRADDAADAAGRGAVRFLPFLDKREQAVVTRHFSDGLRDARLFFWGGYPDAERRMLGIFPDGIEPDGSCFPITALQIVWKGAELTHRDFLGALLSLGIKRDKLGDLVIGQGTCAALLEDAVVSFVLSQLSRVGRTGVVVSALQGDVHREERFADVDGTIASDRLDCVVSVLTRLSRAQAEKGISAGLVALDFLPVTDRACKVPSGATLSVRGYGRFIVDAVGPPTRKGRLRLQARRYL